ncbi:MAG: hypothetical protein IIV84_03330 [Selenomonadales bacterium]|nr:hypothetical protein [Selenomonadales bacterium]
MTILCMMMLAGCASDTERTSADRIVYGALTEPHSLHPLIGTDSASTEVQSLIYDALVCVNGDKKMTGDLAESWTVSNGGKIYTFRLKDGITWHDGQAFTADDVVFTFDMARDKRNGYIDARELANIERVTASGNEVTFRLAKADSAFLARVAGISILPKHIWQKVQNLREEAPRIAPVGTGPYRLVEWKKAQYLRFAANDSYYKGVPHIKTLFYKIVPDSNVMAMQLRRGEVDVCHVDSSAKQLLDKDKSVRVTESAGQAYTYIALNHAKDIFADKRVRRAMVSAFDRQAVIDNVLCGSAYLAAADLPPNVIRSSEPIAYDTAEADRLLTEAGWARGEDGIREQDGKKLAFRLLVSNKNKRLGDAAIAFRQNMMAVGIAVEIVPMDFTTMRTKHLLTGDYEACLISQRLPTDPLLRADVWTTDGAGNHMNYHSARIDALYEKARTANADARTAVFREAQTVLTDEMPQLFLWYPAVTIGVRQGIEGIDAAHLGAKDNIFHNAETWTIVR